MSETVERRLVELLDHPTESPYGNPIPGLAELGETDRRRGVHADGGAARRGRRGHRGDRACWSAGSARRCRRTSCVMAALRRVGALPDKVVTVGRRRRGRADRQRRRDRRDRPRARGAPLRAAALTLLPALACWMAGCARDCASTSTGLTKRFGAVTALDDLTFSVRARRGDRVPRPERRRQDHDAALPARPGRADVRVRDDRRPALPRPRAPPRDGRRRARGRRLPPRPHRPAPTCR